VKQREEDDKPAPLAAGVATFALTRFVAFGMTIVAALLIAFAALLLSLAWHVGPELVVRHAQYAKLTSTAPATIVDSWLALDIDIPSIRVPHNRRASTNATPCMIVELPGEWGSARTRAFCGNRFRFNESYDVPFLHELAPGAPFMWTRDEHGFAVLQIRTSRSAMAWLGAHEADTFMHREWPAKTALEWLRVEMDRPVDAAIAGWSEKDPSIDVAYAPDDPATLLPAQLVKQRQAASPSWVIALLAGVIGLALWVVGVWMLPAAQAFNLYGRIALVVVPLAALPWWSDYMPRAIRFFHADIGMLSEDILASMDPLDRFAAIDPGAATQAGGERLVWRAGEGMYRDTFGKIAFAKPRAPLPPDAALRTLASTVTDRMRAMDDAHRATIFTRLRDDKLRDLTAAGTIFVPAARDALIAANTGDNVRAAARALLTEWVTQPIVVMDPNLPAYDERIAIMQSLVDVPVPEIANLARRDKSPR
jgi:hypothetical protein